MLSVDIKKDFETNGRMAFSLRAHFTADRGITVLFGPSGAGKTTLLRAIAGMVAPDEGKIQLDDCVFFDSARSTNLAMQKRRVGFVFQDYLLFPHLTAFENVGYGIRAESEKARRERARQILGLLSIGHASDRYPRQLSGGEQQRVALARALGSDPAILLLDEPLSALDVSTRLRLLEEIINLQRKSAIPFLYVTHSPADAVRAGDSVTVLSEGEVIRQGKPSDVFNAPSSLAVAHAVGTENILTGHVARHQAEEGLTWVDAEGCRLAITHCQLPLSSPVTIGIRSEDIIVSCQRITATSARNLLQGTVTHVLRDGPEVHLLIACGANLKVRVTPQAVEALGLRPQTTVYLLIKASSCHILA